MQRKMHQQEAHRFKTEGAACLTNEVALKTTHPTRAIAALLCMLNLHLETWLKKASAQSERDSLKM